MEQIKQIIENNTIKTTFFENFLQPTICITLVLTVALAIVSVIYYLIYEHDAIMEKVCIAILVGLVLVQAALCGTKCISNNGIAEINAYVQEHSECEIKETDDGIYVFEKDANVPNQVNSIKVPTGRVNLLEAAYKVKISDDGMLVKIVEN